MELETKLNVECIGDIGERSCRKVTKKCLEAGENGGFCECLCVNKILHFQLTN